MVFGTVPLFPGVPGGIEMMVVLLVVVLLFGANKLPKLARASGQAMGEFRRGREEIEAELRAGVGVDDAATGNGDADGAAGVRDAATGPRERAIEGPNVRPSAQVVPEESDSDLVA